MSMTVQGVKLDVKAIRIMLDYDDAVDLEAMLDEVGGTLKYPDSWRRVAGQLWRAIQRARKELDR